MNRLVVIAATLCVAGAAQAVTTVRFVSCPLFRDVPDAGVKASCWLADDRSTGRRYDVGAGPIKPDWNHAVLIEGVVSEGADVCGGIVLSPVRVSRLEAGCKPRTLPVEGYVGRRYVLPKTNLAPVFVERAPFKPPFVDREFVFWYEFDSDFLVYQESDVKMDDAARFVRETRPAQVLITGYASTQPERVSGVTLQESRNIARQRAEMLADSFEQLGVPRGIMKVSWSDKPASRAEDMHGLEAASKRRVEVKMLFPATIGGSPAT